MHVHYFRLPVRHGPRGWSKFGASFQENLHDLHVAAGDGTIQRTHPVDVDVLNLRPMIEQHLHERGRTLVRGQIERCATGTVRVLLIGSPFQQTLGRLLFTPQASPTQCRQSIFVLRC